MLTFEDAAETFGLMVRLFAENGLTFIAAHRQDKNHFCITSVADADLMKHYAPQAEVDLDAHSRRVATLRYEYDYETFRDFRNIKQTSDIRAKIESESRDMSELQTSVNV